jgi:hypothetical protein
MISLQLFLDDDKNEGTYYDRYLPASSKRCKKIGCTFIYN